MPLARLALLDDCGAKLGSEVFRKGVKLGVAVNLDGFLCGVADHVAVVAPSQVLFEFRLGGGINDTIEVIGQLVQKLRALHWRPSPLLGLFDPFDFPRLWKNLFSRSRNCNLARSNLDFTAGTLKSSASAVSSVERPSTSRSTKTVRKLAGSPWIVRSKISRNSAWLYCCSGFGLQSATSRGTESSSVFTSSSSETIRSGRRRRNFISASFTAIRTSQV